MKKMTRGEKCFWAVVFASALAFLVACASGCAALDRGYKQEVTWREVPAVQVVTNTVVVTKLVPVVTERTNIVLVTNAVTGGVSGYATREPVATNLVTEIVTRVVPVFMTNFVQVPVTNLVDRPAVTATIGAGGSLLDTFLPGVGSIVALALGGLYHGYQQVRNRRLNEALVQGVETARAVLTTTAQGQAVDAQFVKWLMDHQKEAGVFAAVSTLVEQVSDNPAAKMTAQEIMERVGKAQGQGVGTAGAAKG
jgi:hypothetical protein